MNRTIALILFATATALGQKYNGPRPPKPDLPYLIHAEDLVATESTEAKEESRNKEDLAYVVRGASSPARTPLAGPMFLLEAVKLVPERLQLYKLEVKNGNREVFFSKKNRNKSARPLHLNVTRLAQGLFRVEVTESLENGEYSLTPEGSNQVFCFQVY
jgi:hypothetical protein